jgi:hypothetical protein
MAMDLRKEISAIMLNESSKAFTASEIVERLKPILEREARIVMNDMVETGEATSVHGGGGYATYYKLTSITRRA